MVQLQRTAQQEKFASVLVMLLIAGEVRKQSKIRAKNRLVWFYRLLGSKQASQEKKNIKKKSALEKASVKRSNKKISDVSRGCRKRWKGHERAGAEGAGGSENPSAGKDGQGKEVTEREMVKEKGKNQHERSGGRDAKLRERNSAKPRNVPGRRGDARCGLTARACPASC